MTVDYLRDRLLASAKEIGWETREEPSFVSKSFRGREDEAQVQLPEHVRGLRIGRYPVLLCEMKLSDSGATVSQLRAIHNQMIIARSFMRSDEVIDAYIIFIAQEPTSAVDWTQLVDSVERDESVCRKIIWVAKQNELDSSYESFVARTFLAQPWASADTQNNAPLDQNERLVESTLRQNGLSEATAASWVALADTASEDTDALIDKLIAAMESSL